ncbi:hypothetical protein Emed_004876 [Eimeria media]
MGALQALAAAADIDVESDLSGGEDREIDEATSSSKRRDKKARQNLRQVRL